MDNQYYLRAAKMSNYAFARLICKRDRLRREHLDWEKYLNEQFLLLLMPRESLKTTLFVESRATKTILDDGDFRELLICDTYSHSAQRVRAIKRYLQSDEAEMYAPGIRKRIANADKWTENEISIPGIKNGELYTRQTKESNIIACGIESPQTGIHIDRITLDDIVNEKDKKSRARREATIDFFPTLFDIVESDGKITIIGTPWCPVDLYAYIEREYSDIFTIYRQSIYNPDGSIWLPETYPTEKIERLKKRPIHFSHQYLCLSVGGEDIIFNKADFTEGVPAINRVVWGIDPAYSESDIEKACDNALTIWGDGESGAGFLNARIERESLRQFKDHSLLKYLDKYPPDVIVVEDNGVQKAALDLMKLNPFNQGTEAEKYNQYQRLINENRFKGTGDLGGRDKVARAQPMADYAETNGIWYNDTPGVRKLLNQVYLFPAIDEDDGVDSASNGFTRIRTKAVDYSKFQPTGYGKREFS